MFYLSRQDRIRNFPWRRLASIAVGALALLVGVLVIAAVTLQTLRQLPSIQRDLEFDFSLTLPGQTASAVVENRPMDFLFRDAALYGWPLILAVLIYGYSKIMMPTPYRPYVGAGRLAPDIFRHVLVAERRPRRPLANVCIPAAILCPAVDVGRLAGRQKTLPRPKNSDANSFPLARPSRRLQQ